MKRQVAAVAKTVSKDQFCLVFILAFSRGSAKELIVEAARDRAKAVGPFLRGSKVFSQLADKLRDEDAVLLDSLKSIGMTNLPCSIPMDRFDLVPIREWAAAGGRFFKRVGSFGSIRAVRDASSLPGNNLVMKPGKLLNAPVFVRISFRHASCRLFFRYSGVESPVQAFFSSVPLRLESGAYIHRNFTAEKRVLDSLRKLGVDIDSKGRFSVAEEQLANLVQTPPEQIVFLAEKSNAVTETNQSRTVSGIKWFGDDSNVSSPDFLNAYLENRNYVQLDGVVGLFNHAAIARHVERELHKDAAAVDPARKLLDLVLSIRDKQLGRLEDSHRKLRPFLTDWQNRGVAWLLHMKEIGAGAILADEMGLGKTVQAIAFLSLDGQESDNRSCNLIVCPASVVENWKAEITRFEPSLSKSVCSPLHPKDIPQQGLIILSYERAVRQIKALEKIRFDNIVLDEAQKVKNAETASYKALVALHSEFRLMLTGTPIENTIVELWNHVAFVNPQTRGAMQAFRVRYPVLESVQKFTSFSLDILSNFVLIRKKRDVSINLPPMEEKIVRCRMDVAQRNIYESMRKKFLAGLKGGTSARVASLALEALLRLRQCCCLPTMLPTSLNSSNIDESCKMSTAFQIVLSETRSGRKILVFSQFLETIERLKYMLVEVGIETFVITGETVGRQAIVDSFNKAQGGAVFLISLKAGGVGMNLATANCVILLDPWWNPAVESQAFARAHRIGQQHPVEVFKLICEDTVEDKMLELEERKRNLAAGLGEKNLSKDEMLALLK